MPLTYPPWAKDNWVPSDSFQIGEALNDIGKGMKNVEGPVEHNGNNVTGVGDSYATRVRTAKIEPVGNRVEFVYGAGKAAFASVVLADDEVQAIEAIFGAPAYNGTITISADSNGEVYGDVIIRGSHNLLIEKYDALGSIAITDLDGMLCFLTDLDGTYSIKNRRGGSRTFNMLFHG
jgi:hypothetical protein